MLAHRGIDAIKKSNGSGASARRAFRVRGVRKTMNTRVAITATEIRDAAKDDKKNKGARRVKNQETVESRLAAIANDHLHIDTLGTRNSDSLDFHSVAVWEVKAALEAAYQAGCAATK
jgi:hypothetical protein